MIFNTSFRLLSSLILAAAASVASALPMPESVESMSAPRDTRKTLSIAPTSAMSQTVASMAASRLGTLVSGTKVYTVAPTGSMRPLFDDNSVLLTEPAPFDDLEIGDIVLFKHPRKNMPIVHRILEKRGDAFWTKGDNVGRMDDVMVTRENYVGRVYGIIYAQRSSNLAKAGAKTPASRPMTAVASR